MRSSEVLFVVQSKFRKFIIMASPRQILAETNSSELRCPIDRDVEQLREMKDEMLQIEEVVWDEFIREYQ